jgi:hypothetical protein
MACVDSTVLEDDGNDLGRFSFRPCPLFVHLSLDARHLLFFFPMRLARTAFLVRILACNLLILGSYHDIETAPELEFLRIGGLLLYQIGFIVSHASAIPA